jgi:hypothetical protein
MNNEPDIDEEEIFTCGACGATITNEECGVMGACPECVFCPECDMEICGEGEVALLCGKCEACKSLMIDGSFASTQELRRKLRGE